MDVVEIGEAVELHVHGAQALPEACAGEDAAQYAETNNRKHELHVVQTDRSIAVAERLESRDLFSLSADETCDDDVQQKGSHAKKDDRVDGGHLFELTELF